MKRIGVLVLMCAVLILCAGCEKSAQTTFTAMDTTMEVSLWGADSEKAAEALKTMVQQLDDTWSAAKEDSLLSRLYRGEIEVLEETDNAFLESVLALSEETQGTYDPQLYEVSALWGFFDKQYRVPGEEELEQALESRRWDLSGVLKGYAGDQAAQLLSTMQISGALLNMGDCVQTYGQKGDGTPWTVDIPNPAGGDPLGTVSIKGTATAAAAGSYQQYFEEDGVRYHNIIDPQTGRPAASGIAGVTVICWDGMRADALSEALFVMGLENALAMWQESGDFEAVFVTDAGNVYATAGAGFSGCDHEVIERMDF